MEQETEGRVSSLCNRASNATSLRY